MGKLIVGPWPRSGEGVDFSNVDCVVERRRIHIDEAIALWNEAHCFDKPPFTTVFSTKWEDGA